MPLRRSNLESEADGHHSQFSSSSPSSTTTTTPISGVDRNTFQTSFFHSEQIAQSENNGGMPSSTAPPLPPPHLLGPPTNQAVSALAHAMQSGINRRMNLMSDQNRGRRKSGEPNSIAEKVPKNVTGTSREPSVTFSLHNEIAFDEEHSERSQNPVRRTTSTPRNGSIIDEMSGAYPHVRRNSRTSNMMRGSMSNISELAPGPLVLYNPQEHIMFGPPPPMMSRAPSVSQLWIPQAPMPQFAPYYYGPPTHHNPFPPMPLDPKAMRKAMKNARKLEKKRQLEADIAMDRVGCGFYCCDGVAQLLWLIIAITLVGFVAALILAIFIL